MVDHASAVAEKIRISGGGRCNFTNLGTGPQHFVSENPDYCRSALARYTPRDFLDLVESHGIAWHEKHKGQLFCDGSSRQVVDMLLAECADANVVRWQPCAVGEVGHRDGQFWLETDRGEVVAARLVLATGGLSIPKIGASDFAYRIARQFGHRVVEPRPALVPFEVTSPAWSRFTALAGVSLPVRIEAGHGIKRCAFDEDLLFTHRGLSGPAALQASTYWRPGETLHIDLTPAVDPVAALQAAKRDGRQRVSGVLYEFLPRRLADAWIGADTAARPVGECRDRDLVELARTLRRWRVEPTGTEGFRKAEVTVGGVCTRGLDSKGGESRRVPGLHVIGEAVDVTGWLGGYNFQWAWASAVACATACIAHPA